MELTGKETAEEMILIKKSEMEAKLIAEAVEAGKSAGATLAKILPVKVEFTGTVQSISTRPGVDGRVFELKSLEGEVRTFIVNTSQNTWVGFKDLVEGGDFTFTVENTIEGKTTWSDKNGNSGTHKSNSSKVVACKKAFKRDVGMNILKAEMMKVYTSSEGDVALTQAFGSAFASFLK